MKFLQDQKERWILIGSTTMCFMFAEIVMQRDLHKGKAKNGKQYGIYPPAVI